MKKVLSVVFITLQLYCADDSKQPPPSYYEQAAESAAQAVRNIPHDYFLKPIQDKNAALMEMRASEYFRNNQAEQQLMGFALSTISAAAGNSAASFQLANQLLHNVLIKQSQTSRHRAQRYLCQAVKGNHPQALIELRKLTRAKISVQQTLEIARTQDPTDKVLLGIVYGNRFLQKPEDIYEAATVLAQGNREGLDRKPLHALAALCYLHHAHAESYLGPQALAEFMIAQDNQQHLFKVNKSIARYYADLAVKRGLPNDTQQYLSTAIENCVESQESSLAETLWRWMAEVFG